MTRSTDDHTHSSARGLLVALALCCAGPMLLIVVLTSAVGVATGPAGAITLGVAAAGVCIALMVQHRDQEEDDEKPPEASVAVEERVDGLEPEVDEGRLHERRHLRLFVDEPFEVGEQVTELFRRRGNERCGLDGGSESADPVLRGAKLARLAISVAHADTDDGVHLADQPGADGKGLESLEPGLHGADVVDDLLDFRRVVTH